VWYHGVWASNDGLALCGMDMQFVGLGMVRR
jgi:hypothetical protein